MSDDLKIRFVVATRESQDNFFKNTLTGKFLSVCSVPNVELDLYPDNNIGLPKIYNLSIERAKEKPAILVFAHDDISLSDFYWRNSIIQGLKQFKIVGIAGNIRRSPRQPAWIFVNDNLERDEAEYLSGVVAHGNSYPSPISVYGPSGKEVKLLDGIFMASYSQTLIDNNLRFDENFDFHFYDLDFCRSAEEKQVKMGTWPISIVHASPGNFNTKSWRSAYEKYCNKWES